MSVIFQAGYSPPFGDEPMDRARIAHARNWLSGGTSNPSSTATGFFADGPLNSLTYERWKPTGSTSETWEYNHGSSATADYCCIAAHTLTGGTLTVQYYDGSAWQALTPATPITSNRDIFCIFEPVTAQRWRVLITGVASELGAVRFGRAMQFQWPLYAGHRPITFGREVETRTNRTEGGEWAGRYVQRRALVGDFEWQYMDYAWFDTYWRDFQIAAETDPFWIAWRPVSKDEVAYCWADNVPGPQSMGLRDLYSVSLSVRGYLSA